MKNRNDGFMAVKLTITLGVAAVVIIGILACGWLWDYSISTALSMAGRPDRFEYWAGCLLACVPGAGQLCLPVAAIVWLATMFV